MEKIILPLMLLIPLFLGPSAFGLINLKLIKANGNSSFLAIGNPSAIRIEGKGDGPEGEMSVIDQGKTWALSGNLVLNLRSYDTGIALRDRHMKEKYLEVEKFETAVLKINQLEIDKAILLNDAENKVAFMGTLDLHGVSKTVQGDLFIKKVNAKIQVHSNFQIKLSDFNINVPNFAGIRVADSVEIKTLSEIDKL